MTTIGDAIDRALGGPEHFISYNCEQGFHGVCLGYYAGRTCECDCGHSLLTARGVAVEPLAPDELEELERHERQDEAFEVEEPEPTADDHDCRGEAFCYEHPDCDHAPCDGCGRSNVRCVCP